MTDFYAMLAGMLGVFLGGFLFYGFFLNWKKGFCIGSISAIIYPIIWYTVWGIANIIGN